ncbi:MAG: hypothetical protein RL128_2177, partial [Pseudomonadota bacterium]
MVDLPEPESPVKNTVNHFGEREPLRDIQTLAQTAAQFGAGNVQNRAAFRHFVGRIILCLFLHIDHVFKVNHGHANLGLVLFEQLLRVIGAVEILARAVLAGAGMVA